MQGYFAMTVAGSDCSGGAGVQADLKTFSRMGVYGLSAITCVVSENSSRVSNIFEMPSGLVFEQMRLCAEAFEIGVVKTGMLPSAEIVQAVVNFITDNKIRAVVDPVIVASAGTRLISDQAVLAMQEELLPRCYIMTPNLDEAALLLGKEQISESEIEICAANLADKFGCAVLLKGGHLPGEHMRDVLVHHRGVEVYNAKKINGVNTHGTGCTLSAALASALALGHELTEACRMAKEFVGNALKFSIQTKLGLMLNHQVIN